MPPPFFLLPTLAEGVGAAVFFVYEAFVVVVVVVVVDFWLLIREQLNEERENFKWKRVNLF